MADNNFVIEDKRKRRPIELNGEIIATAVYNPDDPMTYKQFMKVFSILDEREHNSKELSLTEKQNAIEKELEDISPDEIFAKINGATQAGMRDFDMLVDAVNAMFGEGICEILLKYAEGGEYLLKFIEVTFKDVNKSRQAIKNKYKSKAKSGVIE